MKKFHFLVVMFCLLMIGGLFAQPVVVVNETFDSPNCVFKTLKGDWVRETSLKNSGASSFLGFVPSQVGDSTEFISDWFDCRNYSNVVLTFSHICKVSFSDEATIEYQIDQLGAKWKKIPMDCYQLMPKPYRQAKFSQKSYEEWQPDDSLAVPTNTWWKSEIFDVSYDVGWERVRFKFKIKRGSVVGTQFAYGWLVDDFVLMGSTHQIKLPEVSFIRNLSDTEYTTGPFVVQAKVATRTLARIYPPMLKLTYKYNMTVTKDSIPMQRISGDSIWEATIPQQLFGTEISYSITGRDTMGNENTITATSVLKRSEAGGTTGYITVGTGTGTQSYLPFYRNYDYGWGRMLYTAKEMGNKCGMITKLAFYGATTGTAAKNQKCYMKAVSTASFANANYVDPVKDGATLVWSGTYTPATGWNEYVLDKPFLLPPGKNLVIYWENYDGAYTASYAWNYTTTTQYMAMYKYQDGSFPAAAGTLTTSRPNVRLYTISGSSDSNSVSLAAIKSPNNTSLIAGDTSYVVVDIKNAGMANLKTCNIHWAINGVERPVYKWTGNLPDNYMAQNITLGYYLQNAGKYDTVTVWVSDPNGTKDKTTYDDTLSFFTYGCGDRFHGDYVVGPNKGADFPTLEEALNKITLCGSKGSITLKLQSGKYTAITVNDLRSVMGNDTLTITSLAGCRDSVVFEGYTGNSIFIINNAHNFVLRDISIIRGRTNITYGLVVNGSNNNVEIRNCYVRMDTVESSTMYCLYNPSGGNDTNIRIVGNSFIGGYYGVYFYGGSGTASYGEDIVFDSNYCAEAYYYGYYFYYNHMKSMCHNVFKGREKNAGSYFYNYIYYCNLDRCEGNLFDYYRVPAQYIYNYYYYCNRYNTSSRGLFCNNEFIGSKTMTSGYGMYLGYSDLDIYNNTFFMKQGYGIYNYNYNAGLANICNNVFVNTATSGTFATIYNSSAQTTTGIGVIDYNLYYSKGRVGYWLGNKADMTAWQSATKQDAHSKFQKPVFFNIPDLDSLAKDITLYDSIRTLNTKLAIYTGLECPVMPGVTEDILGTPRAGQTVMGCYAGEPMQLDAAVSSIAGISTSVITGVSHTVSAVITNMGTSDLLSAKVGWSYNGTVRNAINWMGKLPTYASDTIALGTIVTSQKDNEIRVWISDPNNGKDMNVHNDTLEWKYIGCDSLYHGTYTVGPKGDFEDMASAVSAISDCGMNGPVVLNLLKGSFTEALEITKAPRGLSAVNTLTIQSASGNAADVVFQPTSGYALVINSMSDIRVKYITFDGLVGTGGGTITGACKNIIIDGCVFKAGKVSPKYCFYKPSGICDSIFLQNNIFEGGYYGLYFYGQGTGTDGYNTHIYIDSNKILDPGYYSFYLYYNDLTSFSHNKISVTGNNSYYYNYFYYCNHYNTVCNSFDYSKSKAQYIYTYFYYPHRYNYRGGIGLIANNEFIHPETSMGGYGMYLGYPGETQQIYHNTFYCPGSSTYGIYGYFSSAGTNPVVDLANNIIWGDNYPVYLYGTAVQVNSDNNDFYSASNRIGYWQNTACASLTAWATASGDNTSVSRKPDFLGLDFAGAELSSAVGLGCPALNAVPEDITGFARNSQTTIGCYEYNPKPLDLYAVEIVEPKEDRTLVAGASTPVRMIVRNIGQNTVTNFKIDWTLNGVKQSQYNWTGSLSSLGEDTITLGNFKAVSGSNRLQAWTSMPNAKADARPTNDTVSVMATGCDSLFSGTFTMGKNGDFKDFKDFVSTVAKCGLGGPITLKVLSGVYDQLIIDQPIRGASAKNTITITSAAGNADSVIIINSDGSTPTVVFDGNVNFVILDKVTVRGCTDYSANMSGIGVWNCDSITIQNCKIVCTADDTKYGDGAGICCDGNGDFGAMWILNNEISGVRYGFYLYPYNKGASGVHVIGNKVGVRYVCSTIGGTDISEFCYNTFTYEKDSATDQYLYLAEMDGMYQTGNCDTVKIIGNRWLVNDADALSYCYCYFNGYYADSCVLIANNEFLCPPISMNLYMQDMMNVHCAHNTFYMPVGGLVGLTYNQNNMYIANNIFASGTGSGLSVDLSNSVIKYSDYNNVYGMPLSSLQNATGLDTHSVSVKPSYANLKTGANLLDNSGLECPQYPIVPMDINNTQRGQLTTMGCYEVKAVPNNILPREVVSPASVALTGKQTPIRVKVLNSGSNTVTSFKVDAMVNGVRINQFSWAGTLASKQDTTVNIGSFVPKIDTNRLVVWTSLPNGQQDALLSNDTLNYISIGCDSILHGEYIVNDAKELKAILLRLTTCGVNGPTVVKIANGNYPVMDMTKAMVNATATNTVTFEALNGKPDSVIFQGSTELSRQSHVRFRNLTFNGKSAPNAILFSGTCTDVEFYGCNMLASPTTTSTGTGGYVIYKPSNTGLIYDVRFIKNFISGGYYGMYMYGSGSSSMNTDLVVDSNLFLDQYYYGTYMYYNNIKSFSSNVMKNRNGGANNYWIGLMAYYTNFEKCDGNLFHVRSAQSTAYYNPVYIYYAGVYGANGQSNFTNNEILSTTSSTYYGLYVAYSNINVYNNTILVLGSGAARGIYTAGSGYKLNIMNNLIVTQASTSYPIYIGTVGGANCDYNCLYAPSYAGYSGSNLTFSAWQAAGLDVHGFRINPTFTYQDSSEFLKLASAAGMYVPVISGVNADRLGMPRYGMTVVGAYSTDPQDLDAALIEFPDWSISAVIGQNTTVKVRLMNMGKKGNLTSAQIDWYVRGVKQTPVKWTGNLAQYATADVVLGSFKPVAGRNVISARVSIPNNGKDMEISNDSISTFDYGCDSLLHGYYRVGGTKADFANLNDALTALNYCGVDGPTTMALANGTYSAMTVGEYQGVAADKWVTFTSQSGRASDVTITGTNALVFNSAKYVRFTKLTLGNSSTTVGVSFNGTNKGVDILYCDINSSPTTSSSSYYGIYKPSGTTMDSVRIIGNHINGGYYNVYIYGASTSTGGYNTHMVFDSNLVENAYYYAYYFYYNDFETFNANTFLPRVAGYSYWYINMYYCNVKEMKYNHYNSTRNTSINYCYNYAAYMNIYNTKERGVFANNEIICKTGSGGYGLYTYSSNLDYIHNSIMTNSGTYGVYTECAQGSQLWKSNNIVNYGNVAFYCYNPNNLTCMENNFYSPMGININDRTYSRVADIAKVLNDPDVSVQRPQYIDSTVSLEQSAYTGLACKRDAVITEDIFGKARSSITVRGCYSLPVVEGKNMQMVTVVSPRLNTVVACYPDFSTAEVQIANMGTDTLDFSKDTLVVHMTSDSANVYYVDTVISSGIMLPMSKMNVKLTDFFPTSLTGFYNIKAWVDCKGDMHHEDDTARTIYEVTRVVLPFETYFNVMPQEFAFDSLQGDIQWEHAVTSDSLLPVYGTGMLHFASSKGRASLSRAVIKQVDLQGSSKPKLTFWYAHDNSHANARDYMDVLASTDGGRTYTRLMTVYRYDASYTTPGWKLYQYDLSNYINETCLHIAFEAASYGGADQNVDRIQIQVEQDVEVQEFIVEDTLSACDLDNRKVSLVLNNSTQYDVNYERPDSIRLYVELVKPDSSITRITRTMKGRLYAQTADTLLLTSSFNFDQHGSYVFRAYIDTVTLTTDVTNDTLVRTINVLPDLSATYLHEIGSHNIGDSVIATFHIRNTGNLTVNEMKLHLTVNDENEIIEHYQQPLHPNDSIIYTFKRGFIVPEVSVDQPYYFLSVWAEMPCDMDTANNVLSYVGNVNFVDLAVFSIESPKAKTNGCDSGRKQMNININLYNYGDMTIDSATVHAVVDSANTVYKEIIEKVYDIAPGNTNMSLKEGYKVPNFTGDYHVTVYVENVNGEMNTGNDTMRIEACAVFNNVGVTEFESGRYMLGQNIPNPAANVTTIPYSLPQEGTVRLSVLGVNGQILYSTELQSEAGYNEYELNVANFSNGIYYYSMEFQGKRIVRKMNIAR